MSRRLSGVIAVLAVGGALTGGAVAYAASSGTSTQNDSSSPPATYQPRPAASHDGDCPGMGGDPSGSGGSNGSSAPSAPSGPGYGV